VSWREDLKATLPGGMGPPALPPEEFFHAVMLALGPVPITKHNDLSLVLSHQVFDPGGVLNKFVRQYDQLRRTLAAGNFTADEYLSNYSVTRYRAWYQQQEKT
jgi:hypothetical protein